MCAGCCRRRGGTRSSPPSSSASTGGRSTASPSDTGSRSGSVTVTGRCETAFASALLGRRRRGRSHTPHLDDGLFGLGAVVVDLAAVVNDVASRGRRHRALRIERLAGAHPPGAGENREE